MSRLSKADKVALLALGIKFQDGVMKVKVDAALVSTSTGETYATLRTVNLSITAVKLIKELRQEIETTIEDKYFEEQSTPNNSGPSDEPAGLGELLQDDFTEAQG
jgi:hypothetical protein